MQPPYTRLPTALMCHSNLGALQQWRPCQAVTCAGLWHGDSPGQISATPLLQQGPRAWTLHPRSQRCWLQGLTEQTEVHLSLVLILGYNVVTEFLD